VADEPNYWFPAKRYGWGWGVPQTWQGWLVIVCYLALVAAGIVAIDPARSPASFVGYLMLLSMLLVAICWATGEPPRWRWGDHDEGEP
jgi:hypothetical protein